MEQNQKTILIVEDEALQLKSLTDQFTDEGFRVLKARNGEEGLAAALRERPDIILLDILMPIMDGMTMLKNLREKNSWGKAVPVIMLTNLDADDEKIMKDIVSTEPVYYLVKSRWSLSEIAEKVRERLTETQDEKGRRI